MTVPSAPDQVTGFAPVSGARGSIGGSFSIRRKLRRPLPDRMGTVDALIAKIHKICCEWPCTIGRARV